MAYLRPSSAIYVGYNKSLWLIRFIFLCWGFITVLNHSLLEVLGEGMNLDTQQSNFLEYIFYGTYFFAGLPVGYILKRNGFKKTLFYGLLVSATAVVPMIYGVRNMSYEFIVAGVFVLGAGFTFLQVVCNPFVIFMGTPKNGAAELSGAGAFNSFGTWIAPLLGTLIATAAIPDDLYTVADIQSHKLEATVLPYVLIAVIFVGLAVRVYYSDLPSLDKFRDIGTNVRNDENKKYVIQYRHLMLGAVGLFFYVGAEVTIYEQMREFVITHLQIARLKDSLSYILVYYWGGAMVGRFIGLSALKEVPRHKVLLLCAIFASLLVLLSIYTPGQGAMFFILAVGLFNSIMWPVIFEMGIHGLGRHSAYGSVILIMGVVGGAIIPFIANLVESNIGVNYSLFIPIGCYLYIMYYAIHGHKYKSKGELETNVESTS